IKGGSIKMETTVSEIQIENKEEKGAAEVSPLEERRERKTATLCFKRRKKAAKVPKPKTGSEAAEVARKCPPEAGASDQPQQPAGAWASIKCLMTHRKRSDSSKKRKTFEAEVHTEIKPDDAALSKKKAKSRSKIPCLRFSRGAQKSHHYKLSEDSDYNIRVQGETEGLEIQTQTQLADQAIPAKSTQDLQKGVSVEDGKEVCKSHVNNNITSGENVISVELELENEHSAIQTGTPMLEKDAEVIQEKQNVPAVQTSWLEGSEAENQRPVASVAPPTSAIPDQQSVEESNDDVRESAPDGKDDESREGATEENEPGETALAQAEEISQSQVEEIELAQAEEIALGQAPALKENGVDAEKPRSEESKRMEPIAIIITDTEISEFDVSKSKNVPKQFLISMENEQVGVFANDSDFEGRTSEQYEALLIETASSLVKNAIQLSIEQLVNESVSEDNQVNTLLQ
uniref:A kinase-anchoring proteins AKAP-5 and AKAP-12 calmodulin (CaM)-binding domain-containing protein n=1 Tax=Nannospalax galili TaxID=1026970 RepID=A0A8C6RAR1_NANGA